MSGPSVDYKSQQADNLKAVAKGRLTSKKDGKLTKVSSLLLDGHLFALKLYRISPLESSVVWSIYGAGGKLRPTPCPMLMNGLFVGLRKQAESLHLPPYGQAYTSPVASGYSEHLPLPGCTCAVTLHTQKHQLDNTDVSVHCLAFSFILSLHLRQAKLTCL